MSKQNLSEIKLTEKRFRQTQLSNFKDRKLFKRKSVDRKAIYPKIKKENIEIGFKLRLIHEKMKLKDRN